jgi:hypothetical protein
VSPQNSPLQKGDDMKQVPYWRSTNTRRHCIKFSSHGDLVLGICTPPASWACKGFILLRWQLVALVTMWTWILDMFLQLPSFMTMKYHVTW